MYEIPQSITANDVLNRVAAEVGIDPVTDPFASTDPNFVQLRYLLNTAGEELAVFHEWSQLQNEHRIVTSSTDSGDYPLPSDFNYMINQTGWERASNVPLFGPLSPQDWQYLLGRDLAAYTIYASFRMKEGRFSLFPQPPPDNLDVHFEYMSLHWVLDADSAQQQSSELTSKDEATAGTDIINYHRTCITRYVKLKWYQAKGFETSAAQDDFNQICAFLTGRDMAADVLSAGKARRGFPYLDTYLNTPDTAYGKY